MWKEERIDTYGSLMYTSSHLAQVRHKAPEGLLTEEGGTDLYGGREERKHRTQPVSMSSFSYVFTLNLIVRVC